MKLQVAILSLALLALAGCSSDEEHQPRERERPAAQATAAPKHGSDHEGVPFSLEHPVSAHCQKCSYSSCGVVCTDCDNGKEYYCLTNVDGTAG